MLYSVVDTFYRLAYLLSETIFFDRISRRYSMIILGIPFTIVIRHFAGNTINCFAQMIDNQYKVDYVNRLVGLIYLVIYHLINHFQIEINHGIKECR